VNIINETSFYTQPALQTVGIETNNLIGGAMIVTGGQGSGQIARITGQVSITENNITIWTISSPFSIPLNSTSIISIVNYIADMIIAGNQFENGTVVQTLSFYGIMADNTLRYMSPCPETGVTGGGFAFGVGGNTFTWFQEVVGNSLYSCEDPLNTWGYYPGEIAIRSIDFKRNSIDQNSIVFQTPPSYGDGFSDVIVQNNILTNGTVLISGIENLVMENPSLQTSPYNDFHPCIQSFQTISDANTKSIFHFLTFLSILFASISQY